jgi:hypothetical protein
MELGGDFLDECDDAFEAAEKIERWRKRFELKLTFFRSLSFLSASFLNRPARPRW